MCMDTIYTPGISFVPCLDGVCTWTLYLICCTIKPFFVRQKLYFFRPIILQNCRKLGWAASPQGQGMIAATTTLSLCPQQCHKESEGRLQFLKLFEYGIAPQ